jgi:hypothetical protein
MINPAELENIALSIPEEKRYVFVPIRQDKFDGHFWMDTNCVSGCIDSVFANVRKIQDLIPDWHANNLIVGIVKCKIEVVHEE